MLLVFVRNWKLLDNRYSPALIEGALRALLHRLSGMLDERTIVGRWDEQNFAAILEMDPVAAIGVSRSAAYRLSGEYPVQENGQSQPVRLQAVAGIVERPAGTSESAFSQKLVQMSQALAGA